MAKNNVSALLALPAELPSDASEFGQKAPQRPGVRNFNAELGALRAALAAGHAAGSRKVAANNLVLAQGLHCVAAEGGGKLVSTVLCAAAAETRLNSGAAMWDLPQLPQKKMRGDRTAGFVATDRAFVCVRLLLGYIKEMLGIGSRCV